MVNEIIDGITRTIYSAFGKNYKIYAHEDVKQCLREPAFFVALLDSSHISRLGTRFFRAYNFDVHYFPKKHGSGYELNHVMDEMFQILEYIQLLNNDVLRGWDMHAEIVDDVLHFFVTYRQYADIKKDLEDMESLSAEVGLHE